MKSPYKLFPYKSYVNTFNVCKQMTDVRLLLLHNLLTGLVGRVFANGLGDLGSIPGCVIPKTLKMVLDTSLFNTQQYKLSIKGKVEQSRERSSTLPYDLSVVAFEKGAFWSPSTTVTNFTYLHSNTWNHLTFCKKMSLGSFKNIINKMCSQIIYIWYICIKRIWH